MLRLSLALLLATAATGVTGARADDGEEAEAPVVSATVSAKAGAGRPSKSRARRSSRRGSKVAGHVVSDSRLRATPPPPPTGKLRVYSLAAREEIEVNIYNEDGSYNVEALSQVSHTLRCKRTDTEKDIEPRLVTVLSHIYDKFGKRLEIVSGFRNQRRTSSHHFTGTAADIRVPGVKPTKLRAFVESLDAGGMGVGLYPRTGFVHVDMRPPPSYRWIDWSRSNPNSPDKRPPRGVKRRQS